MSTPNGAYPRRPHHHHFKLLSRTVRDLDAASERGVRRHLRGPR